MKHEKPRININEASRLRKKAERILDADSFPSTENLSYDVKKLITELNVHQIELEIQNEELREAQRRLEESRSRYADLYDLSPIGYFTLTETGLIEEANLTGASMLGRERTHLKHSAFSAYLPLESKQEFKTCLDRVMESGAKQKCELKFNVQGREFYGLMENIRSGGNGDGMIQSALIDITDRKKAEARLADMNEFLEIRIRERTMELEEANRELQSFSYSVSHDLRAPLRAIQGFTRMIEREYGDAFTGDIKRKFNVILENAAHMGHLIEALLDLSRIGRADMLKTDIDMEALAAEILRTLKQGATLRKYIIDVKKLPQAFGDKYLIQQALKNMIENAVKFSRSSNPPTIEIGGYREGDMNVYYVSDNGIGFDMKYADKLYLDFERLNGSDIEGTGIGLAIVRRIMERHGGRVSAEGEVGQGATFYFSLPRKKQA